MDSGSVVGFPAAPRVAATGSGRAGPQGRSAAEKYADSVKSDDYAADNPEECFPNRRLPGKVDR